MNTVFHFILGSASTKRQTQSVELFNRGNVGNNTRANWGCLSEKTPEQESEFLHCPFCENVHGLEFVLL